MPRGAKPGQGRGGRPPGSKNRKTLLKEAALAAAAADPHISPKDFLLAVMRDPGAPIELRLQAARIAAPLCHAKPSAGDPGDSAELVEAEPHGASNSAPRDMATVIEEFERRLAEYEEIVAAAKRAGVPVPPPDTGNKLGDVVLAFEHRIRAEEKSGSRYGPVSEPATVRATVGVR